VIILTLTIKLFAGLADRLGQREITVDVPYPLTAAGLKAHMMQLFPDASDVLSRCLVSRNRAYAEDNQEILETDEIAFIPPVGGGSPEQENWPSCRIVREPLDVSEAFRLLENEYCGGTVIFCGTVREWTKGRQTTSLQYDAYVEMALEQMRQIEADVKQQFPGTLTLQWHRIGELLPKDIAVICAAASPHRNVAFEAARTLIERLKKEVPIWKKEFYKDGEVVWQENQM
jgi:molybdopterin synthase catalytic subunit